MADEDTTIQATPPTPPPVEAFELLLHTDNGARGRVGWFFALQSVHVVAFAEVWPDNLGTAIVYLLAVVLTAAMTYMVVRLAYALEELQGWVLSGRQFPNQKEMYTEFHALGNTAFSVQWSALRGSKQIYAKWLPCAFAAIWFIIGAIALVAWARAAGLLP